VSALRISNALLNLEEWFPSEKGAIAQLGERLVRNEEVIGSIPISSTNFFTDRLPSYSATSDCLVSVHHPI
jgi:hypothetical protein